MKKSWIFILFFVLLVSSVSAHIPNLAPHEEVIDDDISRAYYGLIAEGETHVYQVDLDKPYTFYTNILANYDKDNIPDLRMEVYSEGKLVYVNDPESWEYYYEEYAPDHLWRGPEYEVVNTTNDYTIKVTGDGNYVLAVGKVEVAGFDMLWRYMIVYPYIKVKIFEKFPGRPLLFWLVLIAGVFGAWILFKRKRRKRS